MPSISVDTTDWKILSELQDKARITNVELARAVFLSSSPCLQGVKKREESGLIRRYVTLLDPHKVGLTVSVFIQATLEKQMNYLWRISSAPFAIAGSLWNAIS